MAKRKYPQVQCAFCGKFMSWNNGYYTWTNFGSALDLEPPDPDFAHATCFEHWRDKRLYLDPRYTWQPAQFVKDDNGYSGQKSEEHGTGVDSPAHVGPDRGDGHQRGRP